MLQKLTSHDTVFIKSHIPQWCMANQGQISCHTFKLMSTDTCLMASFQDNLGKMAPERQTILDFNEARDDRVVVASAGLNANYLHLTTDR